MKLVKKILLVIATIIAIPLVIALFVKKEYMVNREITINKPKHEVFSYVKHLRNQDKYSKWVMQDPAMKKIFRGTDGNVGFIYAWDGNSEAGKGEQEIKKIIEGEQIDIEIRFEKPMEGIASAPIITKAVTQKKTKVIWGIQGKCNYPMNFMNLFMGNFLGKDLEKSLSTLKMVLENQDLSQTSGNMD